ncbi:MAG TPA: tetratricopeptide repeat protein, partial [Candidatus Edwardsbacteria bacterium]|nr:tetratricopeptide repeat protein [Candidatus Edwardsbacteria bacterium]
MTEQAGAGAAWLLIDQAWDAYGQDRYGTARAAAARAVQAAQMLDDPALLVQALSAEASALDMLGDNTAALARYTQILGLAEDPATRGRLDDPAAAEAVVDAHMSWVDSARLAGGVPVRALFGVLDAGENYLQATGRPQWRAGLMMQRALTHQRLGELDEAVAFAEEALALYQDEGPAYTRATHRLQLADILREAGRPAGAEPYYQAVLDDAETDDAYGRKVALQGLAWCALARDDLAAARRYALAAVREAEPLGDDSLSTALETAVAVHRAAGDLDAAAAAAGRKLAVARRLGGHYGLYYAVRSSVDVALDQGDLGQ